MSQEFQHISDEDLLLSVDGELSGRRAAKVREHLAACWPCRVRKVELEETIVSFARAHRKALDPQLPSKVGPQAMLRAHMTSLEEKTQTSHGNLLLRLAVLCVVLVFIVYGTSRAMRALHAAENSSALLQYEGLLPNAQLTPGDVTKAELSQVCALQHEIVVGEVTVPLRQRVLDEYGIPGKRLGEYEIDYLISPGLGGAESLKNLWPQPTTSAVWNAAAKDALEERLHLMVCSHQIDLSTAQHEISANWIDAYKKYFHSSRPISTRDGQLAQAINPAR